MKVKYLGITTANLTENALYTVSSETDLQWFITDDTLALNPYPKTDFIFAWEVSSLSELVTAKAYTTDTNGTKFVIVSNDLSKLRVNSEGRVGQELSQVSFTKEFGGVARAITLLQSAYRFEIIYTQDLTKEFATLSTLVDYTSAQGWKLSYLADDSIVITDGSGNQVIPELIGINITF